MRTKLTAVLLALLLVPASFGRSLGDDVPKVMIASRGSVDDTAGAMFVIPGLSFDGVTYNIVIANDDDPTTGDSLLIAVDVAGSTATEIPTPDTDLETTELVFVLLPGEKISLDLAVKNVGLRADANAVDCRILVTRK